MSMRVEISVLGHKRSYAVLFTEQGRDRLVLQTSYSKLAYLVFENGWKDGFQIPKKLLEKNTG